MWRWVPVIDTEVMEQLLELIATVIQLLGTGILHLGAIAGALGLVAMVVTSVFTTIEDFDEVVVA